MKLGAVIIPASTLLQPADLADRIARGQVRHVVTETAQLAKFGEVPGDWTRIVVDGSASRRGTRTRTRSPGLPLFRRMGSPGPGTRCCSTSPPGTTAQPKLVAHTQASYPVGHLSTMYWIGIQPGDVHLNLSSPGWAKHAWSNVFAPWNAGATDPGPEPGAVLRGRAAGRARRLPGDHVLRPADGVADAAAGRPGRGGRVCAAGMRGGRRAAQPGGDRAGAQGLGDHGPGRLRPDRDHRAGRQHARAAGPAGFDGPPAAGVLGRAGRPGDRRAGPGRGDLPGPVAGGRWG